MMQRLTRLVEELEQRGGPDERLRVVRCALAFKRSWIDLAGALTVLRASSSYTAWGYEDLLSYAATELGLRAATVDKLLVSYATLNKHAPERLEGGGDGEIPSYQALDYLARVTNEPRADGSFPKNAPKEAPEGEVLEKLHSAVFDEGHSVQQLRRDFDPLVRPRSPEEEQLLAMRRAASTAQRLLDQLAEVEGIEDAPIEVLEKVIEDLRGQIEALKTTLHATADAA